MPTKLSTTTTWVEGEDIQGFEVTKATIFMDFMLQKTTTRKKNVGGYCSIVRLLMTIICVPKSSSCNTSSLIAELMLFLVHYIVNG
jgi:hypothetical protein